MCESVYQLAKILFKKVNYVHSKRQDRSLIINKFRKGKIQFLFTTAVLERGVTVKGLQVIIFNADHTLYTKEALIQIAGRVGRKKDSPYGEVIYIARRTTKAMEESIRGIKSSNKNLSHMLQGDKISVT